MEVILGENICRVQVVNDTGDKGQWVSILNGDLVEASMVNTQTQGSIHLIDK